MAKKTISGELSRRLRKIKPHLAIILTGALRSMRATRNPLRFANAANALRELFREMLETLAPDECVIDCHWFVSDPTSKNGVTRKHRILYSIHGYVGIALFPKKFVHETENLAKRMLHQIDKLQKLTHITEKSLSIPASESKIVFDSVIRSYLQLLTTIKTGKEVSRGRLAEILSQKLDDVFNEEIFENLNLLSGHTSPQYTEQVFVTDIDDTDKDVISFSGSGSILCELQYGSDGDVRRGDGLRTEDSYPFVFSGHASTNLKTVEVDPDSISIDTSSFYR
ncbi:MAG TPA: hypothetical protein VIG25_06300 [Pyrinomonadaceae bacterium]